MKKYISILSTALILSFNTNAQNGNGNANANTQWRISGNSASTSDFIGTTNNESLILKTNNIQRAIFDTQGKLILDGGGEVIIHPGGLNRPILTNPIANYMLKVGGSGHFDGEVNARQLFVQEYITFLKSLKGPRIDVDSIKMDSTRGIYGQTKIFGDVQIKQNLEVEGTTTLAGRVILSSIGTQTATAAIDPCFLTMLALDGTTHELTQITQATATNLDHLLDANPCPQAPVIPFVWQTYGNHVNSNNRWIGTIENYDFNIKTNNIYRMVVKANGDIGIGAHGGNIINTIGKSYSMTIKDNGDVGIGTPLTANPYNYKLAVNGTIGCKAFKVEINSSAWSDFVFDKDYKLMSLSDLEKFIVANKHLPNIPSNAEVDANNGVDVVEIESKLLQKVEELTLYIIQQQKEIENLKQQIKK